jgi:pimeloyl-ACP methyl ester carboxylesterase
MVSASAATPPVPASFFDRLHAEVFGPEGAPPLLMLHGWGSSAEVMRPAAGGLDDRFRVHNLDLPGHGRTPPPPEPWGVPEYAALVAEYVERHGLAPVPVIGHSNGGRIALYMASDERYAGLFSKLVLVSPSGVTPERPPSYYAKQAWVRTIKAPFALLPDGPLRQRGLDWLRSTIYWRLVASTDYRQAEGPMRETFVKTVTHHLDDRLSRIQAPTLLLWGTEDTAVSRRQMETLEGEIPDAGLVALEGSGHYGYLDDPVTYQAAVRHFLGVDG